MFSEVSLEWLLEMASGWLGRRLSPPRERDHGRAIGV